ncbi:MAG: protein kinase [Chloroflexi bacterium]|nr:protein kinase [Chloroflexota bacterium]
MDNVRPGQMLGPYRIISAVGQGGMATVYKAYHAAMDRYVAIKVLPSKFIDSEQGTQFATRFQQEARTIANLEHPHILPVYDYGESEGVTYFAMRFMDTGTLKERVQSGPLSLAEVDGYFTQLADALGYAHQRGVIHRDVKPSNALVDSRGGLFLTDFGIAKLMENASQLTATGAITGTPAYMSPEQAQGDRLDQRSDIYSLGIVLYQMVTGRVPFEAETPLAVILKQLQAQLPLPSEINPAVSPAIERVLLKALAKNRDDRYATCEEFLAAWKEAYQQAQSDAPTMGILSRTGSVPPTAKATAPYSGPVPATMSASDTAQFASGKKALPLPRWAIVSLIALTVVLVAGTMALPRIRRYVRSLNNAPAPTVAATQPIVVEATATVEAVAATTAPAATAGAVSPVAGQWASWTAGNSIWSVSAMGDSIYTAGPGGITVWNRADGSILKRITTADGLPNPVVNTLMLDADGAMWAGTAAGLAHFDGKSWTRYTMEDGLDSDTITAIVRQGQDLIVGTQYSGVDGGGLNVFDGSSWKPFAGYPSAHPDEHPEKLANFVNAIVPTVDGGLWAATPTGLGRYDGQTWKRYATADGLPSDAVTALMLDKAGDLWAATDAGVARFNGQGFEAVPQLHNVTIYSMLQDSHGEYWFSGGGGVWRFDPAKANWDSYAEPTGELPSYTMFGVAEDAEGKLYFGSETGGLVRYDGSEFLTWPVPNVPSQAAFGHILSAPSGELWFVQLYGDNLDRLDPSSETWSPLMGLPCSCVPLAFDSGGSLWAGEYNAGLWLIAADNSTTRFAAEQGMPSEATVRLVAFAPDGSVWAGSDKGVAVIQNGKVSEVITAASAGLAGDSINALFAGADGSMWVGTDGGASRRTPDGRWEHYGLGSPFSYTLAVTDIAEDNSGAVWIATSGDGAYRLADGKWQRFAPRDPAGVALPSTYVNSVTVAADGSVWFGTQSGAARFDGSIWQAFGIKEGLIDSEVYDIFIDESGTVWFATAGGVSRYKP